MRELYDDYEDLLGRESKSHKSSSKTNDTATSSEAKTKTVEPVAAAKILSSQASVPDEASSNQQMEVVANEAENGENGEAEQECENNVESNGGEGVEAVESVEDSTVAV